MILFQVRNLEELIKNDIEQWFTDSVTAQQFKTELSNNNLFEFLRRTHGKIEIEHQIANMGFGVPSLITYLFDVISEKKFIESINYEFEKYRYRNRKIAYFFKSVLSPSTVSNQGLINQQIASQSKKYDIETISSFCNQVILKLIVERGRELYNGIYSTIDAVTGLKTQRKDIDEFGNELFSMIVSLEYVSAKKLFPTQGDLIVTASLKELLQVQPILYDRVRSNYMKSIKKSFQTGNSINDEIVARFLMNIQSSEKEFEINHPSVKNVINPLFVTLVSPLIVKYVGFWQNVRDKP